MAKNASVTMKELRAKTRKLVAPHLLKSGRGERVLLPEYVKLLARKLSRDVLEDLDADRRSAGTEGGGGAVR